MMQANAAKIEYVTPERVEPMQNIEPTIRQVRQQFGPNVRQDMIVKIAAIATTAEFELMIAAIKQFVDSAARDETVATLRGVMGFLEARSKVWRQRL